MATSVIAAASVRAEREIVDHFRRAGATSPERAVAPPLDLRPLGERRFRRLVQAGVLRPADGGLWLDERVYESYHADRRTALLFVVLAIIGVAISVLLAKNA